MINLEHLNDREFEELCYEIVERKGFQNISWRKGTGKPSSPSDSGRDIQATLLRKDFDGSSTTETFFFECKHYLQGVPPTAIEGALSWATAQRPSKLVIIASNFLSNPCKNFLEQYEENNHPVFEIRVWENKNLELMLLEMPDVCLKWKIAIDGTNTKYLNRYHLAYVIKPKLNTSKYLVELLDTFNATDRDKVLGYSYFRFIQPKIRKPTTGKESMRDLVVGDISYAAFREKLISMDKREATMKIQPLLFEALAMQYSGSDLAEINNAITRQLQMKEFIESKLENWVGTEEDLEVERRVLAMIVDKVAELPNQMQESNRVYNKFCNTVIAGLLEEPEYNVTFN